MKDSTPTPRGILLFGDCLERLPELIVNQPRFDLVYADPPFNAGTARAARVSRGERAHGTLAYVDHWGGIDGFMAMLEPRLEAIRSVMSDTASLWLHLDHRTVHDAKIACDRVFGRKAFRGEVIWIPGNGAKGRNGPSVTHQTILIFAPGERMIWNERDPMLREQFAKTSLDMHFTNEDITGRKFRERHVAGKTYRYYADDGRRIGSVWADCPAMRANTPLVKETTGYPTQKPEKLLERIIRAATLPSSRVLDPMCGSGTTLVAAERLGRSWAGIDRSELAISTVLGRISGLKIPEPQLCLPKTQENA